SPKLYAGLAIDLGWTWLPAPDWIYWIGQFSWVAVFQLFLVLLPLYYPDGRLPGRRWRVLLWASALMVLIAFITALDPASAPTGVVNPMGIGALAGVSNFLFLPFLVVFLGTSLAAVLSLVVRYRRGNSQDRQQLKWLMAAAALLLLAFALQFLVPAFQNDFLIPLVAPALPIAVGIAILRYRLYDIDFIINKALVYGGLAAVITAVYVLIVINIGALIGGSQRLWLSLLSTALIALAFQPLRRRAQRLANRLVYGRRATPYETLSQFSEHLSETYSHEDILDRMSRVLAQGTGAERAEVWVRSGPRLVLASAAPPSTEPVTAVNEERRRLERNLHDGAQQHLVALKIKVGLAEAAAEPESKARPILAQLKHDADEALDNLRELARGIYPPLLASDGLHAALG